MPRLRETQTLLWRLITAPDGVAAALQAPSVRERLPPDGIDALVRGDGRLDAVARLDVYAGMYFLRLLGCLVEDFPAVHAVIGHSAFHGLAREYLAAHPSERPSVRALGRRLSAFLEGHPLSRGRGWLPDLAAFEWALLEAFDAPDAAPLSAEALRRLTPAEWPTARFRLTPSLRILELRGAVREVWAAAVEGREIPSGLEKATAVRVWREGFRVFHRVADPLEVAALRALERGEQFAAVCEAAAAVDPDGAATRVASSLQRWIDDAMIVGIETAPVE